MRIALAIGLAIFLCGCSEDNSSDTIQRKEQEKILKEATAQTGMPAIKNFRERKLLKDILELRDQDGLTTYTYLFSEQTGRLVYLGETIGYAIPYSTQYTNPQKYVPTVNEEGVLSLPQADPNGLYSPSSAEGSWILMKDTRGHKARPVYVEPRIIVSPFPLRTD